MLKIYALKSNWWMRYILCMPWRSAAQFIFNSCVQDDFPGRCNTTDVVLLVVQRNVSSLYGGAKRCNCTLYNQIFLRGDYLTVRQCDCNPAPSEHYPGGINWNSLASLLEGQGCRGRGAHAPNLPLSISTSYTGQTSLVLSFVLAVSSTIGWKTTYIVHVYKLIHAF